MKNSRFQFEYRENASSLHKAVGEILRTSEIFCNNDIYQEYPVDKVNTTYSSGAHHFDWVIPKLFIVIECHGRQHYDATSFTSNVDEAVSQFNELRQRDKSKKHAALAAGYVYVEIPYFEEKKLTVDRLFELIAKSRQGLSDYQTEHAVEIQAVEHEKYLAKQVIQAEQEALRVQEEKNKQKEKRLAHLDSEQHRKQLSMAREFRKQRYRALKGKHTGDSND